MVLVPARSARRALVLVACALALLGPVVSCGGAGDPSGTSAAAVRPTATVEYAPGLTEDLYLPATTGRVPLVVLVPGGGWQTADPRGLADLAASLARSGIAAAPTHIRAAADGVRYPVPVQDVLCAVATAAEQVRARGLVPTHVAVLGHSSGAHLAALAVLAPGEHASRCAAPAVVPDALVGISGPYDISWLPDVAAALLGHDPADDPNAWARANPVRRATLRPGVPVLLLHGADDTTVPVDFTSQFAHALEQGGHPTTVEVVPGADHDTIYRADVAGARVARWLLALD